MRRVTSDHVKAEEALSNGVGCPGTLVKDTAGATHALTRGVPDRESNESKYLKEALDMINDWQSRCSRRRSESHDDQETTEVILVEKAAMIQVRQCVANTSERVDTTSNKKQEFARESAMSATREP